MIHGLAGAEPIARALEAPSLDDVTDPQGRAFRAFADQTRATAGRSPPASAAPARRCAPEAVARIGRPVLVAVGTTDDVAGSGPELAALIPGAQSLEITGRDHMRAVGDRIYKDGVSAFLTAHG